MSPRDRRPELFVQAHPFRQDGIRRLSAPAGRSLLAALEAAEPDPVLRAHLVVEIDGRPVPAELWGGEILSEGALVNAWVQPGDDGNKIIRSILQIAVVALATWVGGGAGGLIASAFWSGVAAATVAAVGNLAINALVPPALPGANFNPGRTSPTYSIEGARNDVRRYAPVPVPFGSHRHYPPYLAQPIREEVGDQSFVRMLFALGPMPIDFEDIRIGQTGIENFDGVEIETRLRPDDPPLTLYANVEPQEAIGAALTYAASWVQRTTAPDTTEIAIILGWRQGLGRVNDDGSFGDATTGIEIRYRRVGDLAWETTRPDAPGANAGIPPDTTRRDYWDDYITIDDWRDSLPPGTPDGPLGYTEAEPGKPIRRPIRIAVPQGQYEVQVRRTNADSAEANVRDAVHWEVLRSVTPFDASPQNELAVLALRIRATDQLNGVIDQLNGIAYRLAPSLAQAIVDDPDYDLSTVTADDWTEIRRTSNPADNLLYLYRGPMAANPRPDTGVNWPELAQFHRRCEQDSYSINWIMDRTLTRSDAAKIICRVARSRPLKSGAQLTVVSDYDKTGEERQLFTPRNVAGFKAVKAFPAEVHAFRIPFVNRDEDWRDDERIVYADGFSEKGEAGGGPAGTVAASKIETFPLEGIDDPDLIWRNGRFWFYTAKLLTESYQFDWPLESVAGLKPGSLAALQHDVNLTGLGSARVSEVQATAGTVDAIILDTPPDAVEGQLVMEAGKSYAIRWRRVTGTPENGQIEVAQSLALQTVEGPVLSLIPAVATAVEDAPALGELVAFGETAKETLPVLVKNIRKQTKFRARVDVVVERAERHAADAGVVPDHTTAITLPFRPLPPVPVITDAVASADGMFVHFELPAESETRITRYKLARRQSPSGAADPAYDSAGFLSADERVAVFPPGDPGRLYDLRIVAEDGAGRVSAPAYVLALEANATVAAPTGLTFAGTAHENEQGEGYPAFLVTADPSPNPRVTVMEVELTEAGQDDWRNVGSPSASDPRADVRMVLPETAYDGRARFRTDRGAVSAWVLVEGLVTNAAYVSGDTRNLGGVPRQTVLREIDRLRANLAGIQAGIDLLREVQIGDNRSLSELAQRLYSSVAGAVAAIEAVYTTQADINAAIAAYNGTISATLDQVGTNQGAINQNAEAIAAGDRTLARLVDSLAARVGALQGAIQQLREVQISDNRSTARIVERLISEAEGAIAAIQAEYVTAADIASAIAAYNSSIEATLDQVGTNTGAINQNALAIATGNRTLARLIEALLARVGALSAALEHERSVSIEGNRVLARAFERVISSAGGIAALVTVLKEAFLDFSDPENPVARALVEILVEASGSDPGVARFRSGDGQSDLLLAFTEIVLANLGAGEDETLTVMKGVGGRAFFALPIHVDGTADKRLIVGPGTGWVLWFGDDTYTDATATVANSDFALGTDGKIYFGNQERPWADPDVLTEAQKVHVIPRLQRLLGEEAGIVIIAAAFSVDSSAYEAAITALEAELDGYDTPVAWDNPAGETDIDGEDLRTLEATVEAEKVDLLDAIAALRDDRILSGLDPNGDLVRNVLPARVPAAAITQHQAALAILASQLSGAIPLGVLDASDVLRVDGGGEYTGALNATANSGALADRDDVRDEEVADGFSLVITRSATRGSSVDFTATTWTDIATLALTNVPESPFIILYGTAWSWPVAPHADSLSTAGDWRILEIQAGETDLVLASGTGGISFKGDGLGGIVYDETNGSALEAFDTARGVRSGTVTYKLQARVTAGTTMKFQSNTKLATKIV